MKNSRRSDREISKELGVSQPTVSRIVKKLEKEGYIKEYTIIPDFTKLGFEIVSITFAKIKEEATKEELERIRVRIRKILEEQPLPSLMAMSGMGLDSNRVFVAVHRNYAEYSQLIRGIKQHPLIEVLATKSFLIDLADKSHFRPFTLAGIAKYLLKNMPQE
jgi:DNA-binding Lrp family transcriptional regulator